MSLSCTAITLWRLMTDGHANFPFFPTRTERGDATASDCFIRQLRVWYSIHRDGVLQPEDRHALILVSRQGQRLYYLRPHLVWLGNGADTSRDDARPAPLSFPPFGCYDDKPRGCCLVGLACAKNLPKNDFFFHRASRTALALDARYPPGSYPRSYPRSRMNTKRVNVAHP